MFALNDEMKPACLRGDMEAFAQKRGTWDMRTRSIDTAIEAFGSCRRAAMMMLGASRMLVGRK